MSRPLPDRKERGRGAVLGEAVARSESPDAERRSDMGRLLRKNPVVFLQKDGLVQSFFPMDGALLAAIEKSSRAKNPTLLSRCVAGVQKALGF